MVSLDISPAALALLPHRCVIEEHQVTGTDGGGHKVREWVPLHTGVPCRLYSPGASRIRRTDVEDSLAGYRLALPRGIAVQEMEMRFSGVADRYGRSVTGRSGEVYEIQGQAIPVEAVGGGIQVVEVCLVR